MKKTFSLLAITFISCHVFAQSEVPLVGATKTIQTTVCKIEVSGSGIRKVNNEYRAPTGWQILTFKPIVVSNNRATYSFSRTRSRFLYTSTSAIYSKFIELLELAAEKNVFQKYEAQIHEMRNDFEKYFSGTVPTYSAITTTGSVDGNNQLNEAAGGRFYLQLKITLVYMPATQEQCLQSLEALKQLINAEG